MISRYVPAQPLFLAGLAPGESRTVTSNVSVADLSRPEVQPHSGRLEIGFTYVGAYRLRGPVAVVETNDVSAVLIYHERTRVGKVLMETSGL